MDCSKIIQEGSGAKYQIEINRAGFDMMADDWTLTLSWGLRGDQLEISKSEMFHDELGRWFFTFSTGKMVGVVTASCKIFIPDTDFSDGYWASIDRQFLCFVSDTACTQLACCKAEGCHHDVVYTRKELPDIGTIYEYLRDCYGNNLVTSEGEKIRVLKNNIN